MKREALEELFHVPASLFGTSDLDIGRGQDCAGLWYGIWRPLPNCCRLRESVRAEETAAEIGNIPIGMPWIKTNGELRQFKGGLGFALQGQHHGLVHHGVGIIWVDRRSPGKMLLGLLELAAFMMHPAKRHMREMIGVVESDRPLGI